MPLGAGLTEGRGAAHAKSSTAEWKWMITGLPVTWVLAATFRFEDSPWI